MKTCDRCYQTRGEYKQANCQVEFKTEYQIFDLCAECSSDVYECLTNKPEQEQPKRTPGKKKAKTKR